MMHSPGKSKNISDGVKNSKQDESFGKEQQCWAKEGHYKTKDKANCKALHSGAPAETVVINHLWKEIQV